jgi:hypothetical protein
MSVNSSQTQNGSSDDAGFGGLEPQVFSIIFNKSITFY